MVILASTPYPERLARKFLVGKLTLRLLPLVRDSGTILRGRLIDLDDAALTTGYPDIVDLNCPNIAV
jgi:hypothetical protein